LSTTSTLVIQWILRIEDRVFLLIAGYHGGMARVKTSPVRREERGSAGGDGVNPVWFKPLMFGFMLLGLLWIVVFYISGGTLPIPFPADQSSWNILIGFGIAFVGFLMTLWWR
jgi:hypothetical protein